jgi:diadenylate cyclase
MGISEVSDAIAVVVSEETGSISITHNGRMIRHLEPDRLENLLLAFYRPAQMPTNPMKIAWDILSGSRSVFKED